MGLRSMQNQQQGQQMDPNQVARQLQSNTAGMLNQAHVNVPQDKQGSVNSIVEHLLRTGQITQKQWAEAQKRAAMFRGRR